jgi:UDP-glucose 4-epimerase
MPSARGGACKYGGVRGRSFFIVGGAGFIGSHFADVLLADDSTERVTAFDNLGSGSKWHVEHHFGDPRFSLVVADVREQERLRSSMAGHDVVIHLASNPDIARAATEPAIDFDAGTLLTHHVVDAARQTGVAEILYASGSGVYGELGEREAHEDHGPLIPVSTYAASKLAGEALLASYCYMFGLRGRAFRFGNVVGPRQTHGVGFDFVRRLRADPTALRILGDGKQSKSYIYVEDVIRAVLIAAERETEIYNVYNVATGDYITVTEIADIAVRCMGLDPASVRFEYTGGDRGWKGDVPVVRLNSDRIRALGWSCERPTAAALEASILSMIEDDAKGLL